ncbi:MAG: hypothetical protein ABIH89_01285 [Elusimicrobiota bacterium]
MHIRNASRILSSIILGVIIVSFSVFSAGFFHDHEQKACSLLQTVQRDCPRAAGLADNILLDLLSEKAAAGSALLEKSAKKSEKCLEKLVFFLLTAMIVSRDIMLLFLILAFAGTVVMSSKLYENPGERGLLIPPRSKYYLDWILKFLTPVAKCIKYRADEYDINPVKAGLRVIYTLN